MQIQKKFYKTLIIFIFLMFLQIFSIKSQIYVGVKGGIGVSKYFFQPIVKQDFAIVYKQGIVFNYLNKKKWGVSIELDYAQKSWKEITDVTNHQQMDLQYFEIPFLTYKKFGKRKSGITLCFGPRISFLNNTKYTASSPIDYENIDAKAVIDYNNSNIYSKFDYSLDAALGYEFATLIGNLQINVNYSQGLKDLFSRDPDNILQSLNQNLYLEFTYKKQLFDKNRKRKKQTKKHKLKKELLDKEKDKKLKKKKKDKNKLDVKETEKKINIPK